MMQPSIEEQMYWIVTFNFEAAHIVVAPDQETAFLHPKMAYHVLYDKLRYLYIDPVSETESVFQERRDRIDPRILADPNTTVDMTLALPQMQGNQQSRESLETKLELCRLLAKSDPKIFQEFVSIYERDSCASDEELKTIIAGEINEKRKYVPEEIRKGLVNFALPFVSGYMLVESKPFITLQSTLDALYSAWKEVKADGPMGLCLYDSSRVSQETRDRVRLFVDKSFR